MLPPGVIKIDEFTPTPDSTPSNVIVIETQITDLEVTCRVQFGTCLIVNTTKCISGTMRIKNPSNDTRTVIINGTMRLRNPLQYNAAFQKHPILTNTELTINFQKGIASIWVVGEVASMQTSFGISRVQITTVKSQIGVSNIT